MRVLWVGPVVRGVRMAERAGAAAVESPGED